jgi:hypothetical protein
MFDTELKPAKRIVRRNLPINDKYTLIDSFYTSMENGTCCDNCNKIIANIAVIKNNDNKVFHVGLDCAETLTHLDGLYNAQMQFNEAKGIRAKINKARKENKVISFTNNCLGDIVVFFDDRSDIWLKKEFTKKYLPDYFANVTNPLKNDYRPIDETNYNNCSHLDAKVFYIEPKSFLINDITIVISLGEGKKLDGTPNGSVLFQTYLIKNGTKISTDTTYMAKDINRQINYQLNTYYFNQFNS